MTEAYYENAQICLNGHVITSKYNSEPGRRAKFCIECGEATINTCPNCNTPIRGKYILPYVFISRDDYKVPSFCHECGQPYPWTEEKLLAAKELADLLDELSEEEQEQLKKSLDDLVKDSPRTAVATTIFKKILSKTGPEIAAGFKNILIDIVSEQVKKSIWG